jgi:hypothetical protein
LFIIRVAVTKLSTILPTVLAYASAIGEENAP